MTESQARTTADLTASEAPLRLQDFLPYRLSVLSNTISRRIADAYSARFGLSVWQWRIMAVLGEHPVLTATEICELTAMDKVAVSRAAASLVAQGRVQKSQDAADTRRVWLSLSPYGRKIYDDIVPIAKEMEAEILAPLSQDDQKSLRLLLDKVAAAASPDRPLWSTYPPDATGNAMGDKR